MIKWNKELNMTLSYMDKKDYGKKAKYKEIKLRVDTNLSKKDIELILPSGESIIMDAEYLKLACEKALILHTI